MSNNNISTTTIPSSGRQHIPHYTGHVRSYVKNAIDPPIAYNENSRHNNYIVDNHSNNENINNNYNKNVSIYNSTMTHKPLSANTLDYKQIHKQRYVGKSVLDYNNESISLQHNKATSMWQSTYNSTHTKLKPVDNTVENHIDVYNNKYDNSAAKYNHVTHYNSSYDIDYGRSTDTVKQRTTTLNNLHTSNNNNNINTDTQYNNILSTTSDIHNGSNKDIHNINALYNVPSHYTGHKPTHMFNKEKWTGKRHDIFR